MILSDMKDLKHLRSQFLESLFGVFLLKPPGGALSPAHHPPPPSGVEGGEADPFMGSKR